jgi:hypothetical protein
MAGELDGPAQRFRPLRPASRARLTAAFVLGAPAWLVGLVGASFVVQHTEAILIALLVTLGSFVVAIVVLAVLRGGRRREERRYEARG